MSANLKSIILMIIGMGCLTLCDLLIKIASQTLPLGQVMIIFGVGSIMVFLGIMRIEGEPVRLSPFTNLAVVLRNIGDLIAINGMCLALVFVPISIIGAVIQTVPLMVTAAAALFLGERVGTRRWLAIVIGFLGQAHPSHAQLLEMPNGIWRARIGSLCIRHRLLHIAARSR